MPAAPNYRPPDERGPLEWSRLHSSARYWPHHAVGSDVRAARYRRPGVRQSDQGGVKPRIRGASLGSTEAAGPAECGGCSRIAWPSWHRPPSPRSTAGSSSRCPAAPRHRCQPGSPTCGPSPPRSRADGRPAAPPHAAHRSPPGPGGPAGPPGPSAPRIPTTRRRRHPLI